VSVATGDGMKRPVLTPLLVGHLSEAISRRGQGRLAGGFLFQEAGASNFLALLRPMAAFSFVTATHYVDTMPSALKGKRRCL
jgi:hypothetical protein